MLIRGLSASTLLIYNIAVLITLIFLLRRYKSNQIAIFIIILFWGGLFADMGKIVQNIYKIAVVIFGIHLPYKYYFKNEIKAVRPLWIALGAFVVFVVCVNLIVHRESPLLVFSQMYKYVVPAALFPILLHVCKHTINAYRLNRLFGEILVIQIALNVVKLIFVGGWYEGLVGSITGVAGGGAGTTLPLLGLCWFALNTNMNINNKKSIFFLIGFLFIGWMAGKRAVWLLFPILFFLLGVFVSKTISIKRILPLLLLLPLFLYLGLRLSPTLNPEKKIWGGFDPIYAWNYTMEYSAGKKDVTGDREVGAGRVGANTLLFQTFFNNEGDLSTSSRLIGLGIGHVFAPNYEDYSNRDYYLGISTRGALTGFGMFVMAFGVVGLILFILYILRLTYYAKNRNLKYIFQGVILFDFVFYNSTIVQDPAIMIFMMFAIAYSNKVYDKNGKFIDNTLLYNSLIHKIIK